MDQQIKLRTQTIVLVIHHVKLSYYGQQYLRATSVDRYLVGFVYYGITTIHSPVVRLISTLLIEQST